MSFELKITVLTFIGAFALGALLLYFWDHLYTKTTGRPASERVRERIEQLNRPLTLGRYYRAIALYLAACILFAVSFAWGNDFRRGRWLATLG
jgi:hypothetical protein